MRSNETVAPMSSRITKCSSADQGNRCDLIMADSLFSDFEN